MMMGDEMALQALKCPSCGANNTLDDDREFGYCAYCGSQIKVGDRINVHVTHEFKGETPHVNVTNQYYYVDQDETDNDNSKPHIVIEKPSGKKLGWGIVLAIFGIIGLSSSAGKQFSYIGISLAFLIISIILLYLYFKAMKLYSEVIRNASKNQPIYHERKKNK